MANFLFIKHNSYFILSLLILNNFLFLFHSRDSVAQQFGKNKTQYKIFDWKYIESKHFDVYYEKGS